ncbi:required for drug-induced death protein 1-like [Neosynchiropus ocellatus]
MKSKPLSASRDDPSAASAKYQRHLDADEPSEDSGAQEVFREIHFGFSSEQYEPLVDEGSKEEKKRRKKEKYKKVRKNVGKALRTTWKCLMLGLYNFALGYSTPVTVAATFVPDFHTGRNKT